MSHIAAVRANTANKIHGSSVGNDSSEYKPALDQNFVCNSDDRTWGVEDHKLSPCARSDDLSEPAQFRAVSCDVTGLPTPPLDSSPDIEDIKTEARDQWFSVDQFGIGLEQDVVAKEVTYSETCLYFAISTGRKWMTHSIRKEFNLLAEVVHHIVNDTHFDYTKEQLRSAIHACRKGFENCPSTVLKDLELIYDITNDTMNQAIVSIKDDVLRLFDDENDEDDNEHSDTYRMSVMTAPGGEDVV